MICTCSFLPPSALSLPAIRAGFAPFARRESFQASGRDAQSDASGDMQPQPRKRVVPKRLMQFS